MALSVYVLLAMFGILATMSIHTARQYHADIIQQIEIAERAIQERDIILTKCQSDGTNLGNEMQYLKSILYQATGELDPVKQKVANLEGKVHTLKGSVDTLKGDLAQVVSNAIQLEKQISEDALSTAEQIKPLQDELQKAKEDLAASQGQLKEINDKLLKFDK